MSILQGLLVGFNLPLWQVFAAYAILTPLLSFLVIGPVFESRLLPVRFRNQFLTFTVGDLCLAVFATWMTMTSRQSEYKPISALWVVVVLVITTSIAVVLTRGEYYDKGEFAYAKRAVLSPTKLYHNIVLYAGYGWLLTMLLTEVVLQGVTWSDAWMLTALVCWAFTMYIDNAWSSRETKQQRAIHAHTAEWRFCVASIRANGWTSYARSLVG